MCVSTRRSMIFSARRIIVVNGGSISQRRKEAFERQAFQHGAQQADSGSTALLLVISDLPIDQTKRRLVKKKSYDKKLAEEGLVLKPSWLEDSLRERPPRMLPLEEYQQIDTAPALEVMPAPEEPPKDGKHPPFCKCPGKKRSVECIHVMDGGRPFFA